MVSWSKNFLYKMRARLQFPVVSLSTVFKSAVDTAASTSSDRVEQYFRNASHQICPTVNTYKAFRLFTRGIRDPITNWIPNPIHSIVLPNFWHTHRDPNIFVRSAACNESPSIRCMDQCWSHNLITNSLRVKTREHSLAMKEPCQVIRWHG